MQLIITGRGVDLTDAIENYVSKKIQGLDKFFPGIMEVTVMLGQETHHHKKGEIFFAEGKMELPGQSLFAKKTANDVYAAVDVLKDHLEGELKKYKTKLRAKEKKGKATVRKNKEYQG